MNLPLGKRAMPWLLAAVSGVLLSLSFPPFGLWPLAWVALVPLLWAVQNSGDVKTAANLGAWTGLVFYGISLHWLLKVFGPMGAAFWCVFALWIALDMALLAWMWNRWVLARPSRVREWAWVALNGIFWTGLEYFRSEVWWLNNSFLALGYSQVPGLPVLQLASLAGLYGLSFLLAAGNGALCLLLRRRLGPALGLLGILAVAALWGRHRAENFPWESGTPVAVALVQEESFDVDRLARLSLEPEARRADLLVWPEYSFLVEPGREKDQQRLLSLKLKGSRAVAALSGAVIPENPREGQKQNFTWVFSPDGALLGRYDKFHPIPFVEKGLPPNPSPQPVKTPLGVLGIQICYDLDFEDGARRLARSGAEALIVPNLDPASWGLWQHRQHSAMAPLRAVESGLWIARSASSGHSQIIDPAGRVRASLPALESGVLLGKIWLSSRPTFYSCCGWLLGPACLVATVLASLGLLWGRLKTVKRKP